MLNDDRRRMMEERLLREREQTMDAIGRHEAQADDLRDRVGELSVVRLHPADVGSEAHEQEKDFLLASVEGRRLYAIDEALGRLYREPERFGRCTECGAEIEWERLEVIPETTLCARHAQARASEDDADPREAWRDPASEEGDGSR